MLSGRSYFVSWSMMLKKLENNVGARTHPCLTLLEMGKLPDRDPLCFTWPCWPSWSWWRMVRNLEGQPRHAGFSTVHQGRQYQRPWSGLWKLHIDYVLFSAFLLYLPQHKDHVYGPSVGPEYTLAFWCVFLCYCQDEPIQQDMSQDSACNRETRGWELRMQKLKSHLVRTQS